MKLSKRIKRVEEIVGHHFDNQDLVVSAITHPSAAEGKAVSASYERLEFLGDSVLGGIIAYDLYERFPAMDEGQLSQTKLVLVSGETLSEVAGELGLAELILLGVSEMGTGARGMHKALEDVYEALVGALYLDAGYEGAHQFVARTLHPRITEDLWRRASSAKSLLQEVIQRDYHMDLKYKLVGEAGPAHSPTFTSVVLVGGTRVGRGSGASKKESQAAAARDALERMGYDEQGQQVSRPEGGLPCI